MAEVTDNTLDFRILLDGYAYREAVNQRALGESPLRWHGLLDRISPGGVGEFTFNPFGRGDLLLAWHFSSAVLAAAVMRVPFAYICWGLPNERGFRHRIAEYALRRARKIGVNDSKTREELEINFGLSAVEFPYYVDCEFYRYSSPNQRENFIFCPGSNDRDGDFLLSLAVAGHRIIWLNNDRCSVREYSSASPRLSIVSGISFADLRDLYAHCKAVVIPLRQDLHAAGQTTSLEALASGAPVFISPGRTSSIYADAGLVRVLPNRLDIWDRALRDMDFCAENLEATAKAVRDRFGYMNVTKAVMGMLEAAAGGR